MKIYWKHYELVFETPCPASSWGSNNKGINFMKAKIDLIYPWKISNFSLLDKILLLFLEKRERVRERESTIISCHPIPQLIHFSLSLNSQLIDCLLYKHYSIELCYHANLNQKHFNTLYTATTCDYRQQFRLICDARMCSLLLLKFNSKISITILSSHYNF